AVAGAVFAYAPWRIAQDIHLNIISSGGIPLSLFLMLRGFRKRKPRLVLAGWLVAGWQLSLGFALGLQLAYLLAAVAAVAAGAWLVRGRPRLDRSLARASALGIAIFLGWAAIQARPIFRVVRDHPEARRTMAEVTFFSPPPRGLLAAPAESLVWGKITAGLRETLPWPIEQTLFVGALTLTLALAGLVAPTYRRSLRILLAIGVVVSTLLALGFRLGDGRFTYRLLYEYAPGWQGVRTPGRLITITTLALALLAAGGAQWMLVDRRRDGAGSATSRVPKTRVMTATLLVVAILIEGSGRSVRSPVPPAPPGLHRAVEPRLHVPSDYLNDLLYVFWSTEGFPLLANGTSSVIPPSVQRLRDSTKSFPDPASVEALKSWGIRTVVLHTDLAPGTPWEGVAARPVDGLPLVREKVGKLFLYHL
ncbi:MAG: hypothetical protein ACREJP_10505, partial [Candidatus Methylomirabilales bacterium]